MKRGFTILELLVASLLLGMLVTILTMIFNQSSIAWRTGVAGVADLDDARANMAELRDEADNVYIWNNKPQRLLGLWNERGKLRTRAVDAEGGLTAPRAILAYPPFVFADSAARIVARSRFERVYLPDQRRCQPMRQPVTFLVAQ